MDDAAKRYGMEGNYVAGANIAGFEKVVDAMTAQGIVQDLRKQIEIFIDRLIEQKGYLMDRMSVRYSFYILGKCFPNMQKTLRDLLVLKS